MHSEQALQTTTVIFLYKTCGTGVLSLFRIYLFSKRLILKGKFHLSTESHVLYLLLLSINTVQRKTNKKNIPVVYF